MAGGVFGGGEPETPEVTPEPVTPEGPRRLEIFEATASTEAAPVGDVTYDARRALDGSVETWWQESRPDDGVGEWIKVQTYGWEIHEIQLVPGYGKVGADSVGDRWMLNNRLARIQIDLSDATFWEVELPDERGWKSVKLDQPVQADWFRIKILDVYPGHDANGDPVRDSGIAELRLIGLPASD